MDRRGELPPAYDQGHEGSCTAFATGAAYRHARRRRNGWPLPQGWSASIHYNGQEDFDISFACQYYLSREKEGTQALDAGASIRDAVATLHDHGACAWHNYPYIPGQFARVPPSRAIANAAHHETASYYALDGSADALRRALAAGYLPVIGIVVHRSFYSTGTDGNVPMPTTGIRCWGATPSAWSATPPTGASCSGTPGAPTGARAGTATCPKPT